MKRAWVMLLALASTVAVGADAPSDAMLDRLLRGEDLTAWVVERGDSLPVDSAPGPDARPGGTASAVRGLWQEALRAARADADDPAAADARRDAVRAIEAADLLLDARLRQLDASAAGRGVGAKVAARLADWRARMDLVRQPLRQAAEAVAAQPDGAALRRLAAALRVALDRTATPPAILAAGILPNHRPRIAPGLPEAGPAIVPSYARSDAGEPTPDDRAPSADAAFTEAVLRQAAALGHDAARIFDFVRGQVDTQWYAGSMKAPDEVLRTRAGNDVDQARLLVALLRASGVGARYVRGVVRAPTADLARQLAVADARVDLALRAAGIPARPVVAGGALVAFEFEHVWVSAFVPFGGYRGAAVDRSSPVWVPLMPALKPYRFTPATGATTLASLRAPDWIDSQLAAPVEGLPLARLRAALEAHFAARQPPVTLESQGARRGNDAGVLGVLPVATAHPVLRVLAEDAVLWPGQVQRLRVVLRGAAPTPVFDATLPVDVVAGRRITLSFVPATVDDHDTTLAFGGLAATPPALIRVRAQLMLDGRPAAAGDGELAIGDALRLEALFTAPGGEARLTQDLVAGGYAALVVAAQGDAVDVEAVTAATTGDAEPAAARLLAGLGARYLERWNRADAELADWVAVTPLRPLPSAVLVLGLYEAQRIGAVVDRLDFRGVGLDAGLRPVEPVAQREGAFLESDFLRWSAFHGSALEHDVFESQWGVPAVSADKALAAAPAGQRVRLTRGDSAAALEHPQAVRDAIQAWIDDGKVVDTVRTPMAVADWRGAVWRVQDLASGESGWFIAGGLAGGSTAVPPSLWTFRDLAEALANPYAEDPNTDPSAAALVSIDASARVQRAVAGERVERPLVARVRDVDGRPVRDAAVTFEVIRGTGRLFDGSTPVTRIVRTTDRFGLAQVEGRAPEGFEGFGSFEVDETAGPHPQLTGVAWIAVRVASARGEIAAGLPYEILARPAAPAAVRITREGPALVFPGLGGQSLRADVLDRFENRISNMPVLFRVQDAGTPHTEVAPSRLFLEGACGDEPLRNQPGIDCGGSSETVSTTLQGARIQLLPTTAGSTTISVTSEAGGIAASSTWTTRAIDPVGDLYVFNQFAWLDYRSEGLTGRVAIDAAPPGQPFPLPRRVSIMRLSGRTSGGGGLYAVAEPASGGSLSVDVENATATAPVPTGQGAWQYDLTAGPAPGRITGTFSFQPSGGNTPAIFHPVLGPAVVRVDPPALVPEVVPLSPFGATEIEFRVQSIFEPAGGYVAAPSSHVLRAGDRVVAASRLLYDDGSAATFVPRGTFLSADQPNTVTAVLNDGTPYRLESPPARLRFRQELITGVGVARLAELADGVDAERLIAGRFPLSIDLRTEIDVAANFVCTTDSTLLFSLARQARATVEFLSIDEAGDPSPVAYWTPIGDETRGAGVHRIDIPVDRLPFGQYLVRVRATAVDDGEQDLRVAELRHQEDREDALPLAHSFVKGVNVFNGGAVIAVEDIDLGGVGPAVTLARTYVSQSGDELGIFGRGWKTNLESKVVESSCGTRAVEGGAGQGQRFERDRVEADGRVVWRPLGGYNGLLVETSGAYDFFAKDGTRYHYAEPLAGARRLTFIEDPNGNRMTVEYAQRGFKREVVALHDDDGRSVRIEYALRTFTQRIFAVEREQRQWVVTAVRAPGDLTLEYEYDAYGNLVHARRPRGLREESYGYVDVGGYLVTDRDGRLIYNHLGYRLEKARDALNGGVRRYTHTKWALGMNGLSFPLAATRVMSLQEPDAGTTTFDYVREAGQPPATIVTDARNHPTRYEMNAYGAVEVQTDPVGTTRTAWDLQRWQPLSMTDANGRVMTYGYDSWGNRTLERMVLDGRAIERRWTFWPPETFERPGIKNREHTATDGRSIVTTTTWDARGNLATRERGGITESWTWSARGLLERRTDGFGATTAYGWDPYGFPKAETRPEGGVTQWVHDERGRKVRETDANGHTTDFEHDQRDRLRRVLHPAIGGERATERIDYDDAANTVTRTDAREQVTVQTFDDMGRLVSERQATNETRTFTYDQNGNRTSETDFRGNLTTQVYDAANRLERREEPLGRITVYEHDAVGNVTAETISGGDQPARRTEFRYLHPLYRRTLTRRQLDAGWLETTDAYDNNGNRTSLTDAENRTATFEYDDRDRLVFERRPLGHLVEYAYDGADRRIRETRSNPAPGSGDQIRRWRYDGDGRLREQVDADENATTFDYDPKGNRIVQTNARGAVRRWTYDARDRLVVEEGPVAGWRVTYALDANGNRIGETLPTVPDANRIVRTFDPLNRMVRVEDSVGLVEAISYDADGHVTLRTNANDRTTTFVIDALGRVEEERRPLGRTWKRTWTVHGELLTETDPRNFTTRHAYDRVGRRTATILPPREGASGDEGTSWTYDGVGNLRTQTDARGHVTTFDYDELHRRIGESVAGVAVDGSVTSVTRSWTYDTVGNVITETDRRGIVTAFTWDRENRRTSTTRDDTLVERVEYDAVGNIERRTDANGTATRIDYDLADRPEREIAGDGTPVAATTRWTYTPLGDALTLTDPEARTTTQAWDARRRLVRLENAESEVTTYEHDGLGQVTRIVPPKGEAHASSRTYDGADRLQTVTDGEGNAWTYGYNTTDQRISIRNPRGHTTTFDFDGRGLLTSMTYAGGSAWTYAHDADGHRVRETSPDGITRSYQVDALGRRRSAAYTPTVDGEPSSTHWTFDPNGNLLTVEDRFAAGDPRRITRTWDRRDRIASETDPHGRTLRYTYDPHGNRLTRIDEAAGETTMYTWDARHRNTSVSSPSSGTTTVGWYRDDRQHTVTRPGNVVSTTTWDRAGRVEGITHVASGSPLVTLAYDYDLNGNRASETLTHASQPPITSIYRHDEADRLQSMTVDGVTTTYTLDGAGNRTGERTAAEGAPATRDRTCTYDPRDRVVGCTDATTGTVETYAWDATGRMTQETIGGLTRTHAWDSRDRLLRIEEAGGPTTTYAYDPEGLRIETTQGTQGERVQYDAGHRHAEINGAGNVTRRYQAIAPHRATNRGAWARLGAAAMTLFLGMTDAGAIPAPRHYLHDAHGSPVAITTDQGAIAQRSAYDVWGNPTRVETLDTALDANPNRIGYTGYTLDLEGSRTTSGAAASANSPVGNARYYAKARYYGAGRGSFISVDPWDGDTANPVSLNKYLYGYANPGIYVDPDGQIGFLTDLRDRFDRTDAILRQNAVEADGTVGLLGYSLLRGLAAAGSAIPRALNTASDAVAQALPGETFSGVRADGAAEFANTVDAGVYVASNPGQVARDIHGNAVQTTVRLAEGDRGAASDAISFLGQVGGGAAAGRALGFGAGAGPHAPRRVFEGENGKPAARFIDPAMADELDEIDRPAGRGIEVVDTRNAVERLTARAVEELRSNPEIAQDVLSPGSYRHLAEKTRLAQASFGKAVERLVAKYIQEDVRLSRALQHTGVTRDASGRFVESPDFIGKEGYDLRLIDITTEKDLAKHRSRPRGEATDHILHAGLPEDVEFPKQIKPGESD